MNLAEIQNQHEPEFLKAVQEVTETEIYYGRYS